MGGEVFLPGGRELLNLFLKEVSVSGKKILVLGAGSGAIAERLAKESGNKCEMIVEEYDSFINSKLSLQSSTNVNIRMMSFESTDFENEEFDIIYAQGPFSSENRNKIIKEVLRMLKTGGMVCSGEIVSLDANPPAFVRDIWNLSALKPLYFNDLKGYYEKKNLHIIFERNLSSTLRKYYSQASRRFKEEITHLSEQEQRYNKKLLSKISHETNAFLKLGGDKYIGFRMLIMEKKEESGL